MFHFFCYFYLYFYYCILYIVNVGRRAGGGLKALSYEPNRKSIFDDLNFGGGLGLNRKKEINNNKYNCGYKKDLGPIKMKEKKSDNYYGYNREDKFGSNGGNNYFAKKDKFNLFEKNKQLFNQFNIGSDGIFKMYLILNIDNFNKMK